MSGARGTRGSGRLRVLAVDHTATIPAYRRKHAALAARGGLELSVLIPERWVELYHEVHAGPDRPTAYRLETGRVVWPGYENRAFFTSGLGAAIRRARPDVIHLWEEPYSLIALQAMVHAALWAPRAKLVFTTADNLCRDFRYPYRPWWFYAAVERLSHRRCHAGVAITEDVEEVLRAKGFGKPVEILPLGIDLADYPASADAPEEGARASAEEAVARFGLRPPIVGFAGRLLHQKGVDVLLRAVAALPASEASLVVVGEGPERASLEALAASLGLAERVRFFPLLPHGDVPALLRAIDVLVLPSRTTPRLKEQFGRVLVEGMAAGCVVIGSSSGAIPSVLGDGGLVFREEDSGDLAARLRDALGRPDLARDLRRLGRRRVASNYTWDAIAEKAAGLYERLAAGD